MFIQKNNFLYYDTNSLFLVENKKDGSSIRDTFKKVEIAVFLVGYYQQQNIDI